MVTNIISNGQINIISPQDMRKKGMNLLEKCIKSSVLLLTKAHRSFWLIKF